MNFLFCSKYNLFDIDNKKGGDLSNIQIIKELSVVGNVSLAIAHNPSPGKYLNYIKQVLLIDALKYTWPLFLIVQHINKVNLRDKHYDFIVAPKGGIVAAYLLSKKYHIPFVIITRDFHELPYFGPKYGNSYLRSMLKYLLLHKAWRKAYESAYCIITSSNYLGEKIISHYKVKNQATLYPLVNGPIKTRSWSPSLTAPIGMISGSKYKGEQVVMELARRMPSRKFVIFNSVLSVSLPSNVQRKGYTSKEEIFGSISLLIIPSDVRESFGRVAIEAHFFGVPCLAHDIGGLREALSTPLLRVSYRNINEWNDKIEKILCNNRVFRSAVTDSISKSKNIFILENHSRVLRSIFRLKC
jgi:glycosyltransferase involved in cell wall biosynthesis